jgi:hypothetical protein
MHFAANGGIIQMMHKGLGERIFRRVAYLERDPAMKTNHSLRLAWLCLLWMSVMMLGALACSIPLAPVTGTATAVPTDTIVPTMVVPTAAPTANPPTLLPAPTATQQRPPAPQTGEVLVFLVAIEDNGTSGKQVGCGDSLVPVRRSIAPTPLAIVAALNELFALKGQYYGESGLYNALYQSNLRVDRAVVDANGVANVVISGQVLLGGTCDTPRFKGQIEETILSISGVKSASIMLNGKPIDEALSSR